MSKRSFPVKLFFFIMKGKLLISSPGLLTDMIFYKSIILIVDQTDEGFTGFILNSLRFLIIDYRFAKLNKYKFIILFTNLMFCALFFKIHEYKS